MLHGMMRFGSLAAFLLVASPLGFSPKAMAAGLDTLSAQNPETKAAEEDAGQADEGSGDGTGSETGSGSAKKAEGKTAAVKSAASQSLEKKLFFATSFGWVKASKSGGTYEGSGMSDFTAGYKIPVSLGKAGVYGTYRYAPVAVSGKVDGHSYRGVWENHLFGARGSFDINSGLAAFGSAELGLTLVHLTATDGLGTQSKDASNGGQLVLGGGADWSLGEGGAFTAGPRLYAGFGSFTTIQFGGGFGFLF